MHAGCVDIDCVPPPSPALLLTPHSSLGACPLCLPALCSDVIESELQGVHALLLPMALESGPLIDLVKTAKVRQGLGCSGGRLARLAGGQQEFRLRSGQGLG